MGQTHPINKPRFCYFKKANIQRLRSWTLHPTCTQGDTPPAHPSSSYTHSLHTATTWPPLRRRRVHRGHSPTPGGPQGRAPTGLGSGPGVTGTGNARVSVPGQGLEVEARVSGRHNSRPLRLLTPRGESHRRGPRAGAPCGTSSLSTARQGKKPLELPTHPHTQKTDRFSLVSYPILPLPISVLLDFKRGLPQPCLTPSDRKLHLEFLPRLSQDLTSNSHPLVT